jgi:uncharacterized membrane protein
VSYAEGSPPRSPRSRLLLFCLSFVFAVVALLVLLNVISFAYERLGLSARTALLLLLASLLGAGLNIPVARMRREAAPSAQRIRVFGVTYVLPAIRTQPNMIVAVNVDGAVVPVALSVWLLVHGGRWWQAAAATAILALFVHLIARPVAGVGIVVPGLAPPVAAALLGIALGGAHGAAELAYVAGTLGTLIGADLTNLAKLPATGASVVSIGGAGTFDGVFLTGVVAVVLATLA